MVLILDLPTDVFLYIFYQLSISDILNIRQTCRAFFQMSHSRSVWHLALRVHIQQQNIPVPRLSGQSIEALTASQLEQHVRCAWCLRKKWMSPLPTTSNRHELMRLPSSRIISLEFIPGHEHRWLISLSLIVDGSRNFTLQCWNLHASPPICVAIRTLHDFGSLAINTVADSPAHLAIQSPSIEILKVDMTCTEPTSAFVTVAMFLDKRHGLLNFSGSTILMRDDRDRLYHWDINSQHVVNELQNFEHQVERPLEALVQGQFIVIIRPSTLEIYALPSTGSVVVQPVSIHRWQWRLDSVNVSTQASWQVAHPGKPCPINILIRYGSLLPWPLNVLHYYILRPNASYELLEPVGANNLPYDIEPFLQRTIASPVRLFATYNMAIGSYGTAIWIDSHTEEYFERGDRGQRLAGSLHLSPAMRDRENDDTVVPELRIESTQRATVFSICEDDKWVRLAVDEEEGRIAVGSTDGTISILEYA